MGHCAPVSSALPAVMSSKEPECPRQKFPDAVYQRPIFLIQVNVVSLDSTCIKVHPDGMGALKKVGPSLWGGHAADGTPSFIWLPHLIGMG